MPNMPVISSAIYISDRSFFVYSITISAYEVNIQPRILRRGRAGLYMVVP